VGRFLTWDPIRDTNLYWYVENSPTVMADERGTQPLGVELLFCQNEPFTNKKCRDACDGLFEKSKLRNICYWVCNTLKGKTCNELFAYCMHLKRGGLPNKKKAEICMLLYNALCGGE
jgi:hypothetical protein